MSYFHDKRTVTWYNANTICKRRRFSLAVLDDPEIYEAVKNHLVKHTDIYYAFWIGLVKEEFSYSLNGNIQLTLDWEKLLA